MLGWVNLGVTLGITSIAIVVAIILDYKIKQNAEYYRFHRYLTRLVAFSLLIEQKYSKIHISLMAHALVKSTEPIMFYWYKKSKISTYSKWINQNKKTFNNWRNAEVQITSNYDWKKFVENTHKIIKIFSKEIARYKKTKKKLTQWYNLNE